MSKQQLLKDLIGAKALIDSPEKWIQGNLAYTADGIKTGVCAKEAACFCSMGAFVNYLHGVDNEELRDRDVFAALDAAVTSVTGKGLNIVAYNDTHTHTEVMAVWDGAIAAAQVAVQIENLEVLRAAVQEQPEDLFDLTKYKQERPCGTLFCTIGLASTMPHFQALGVTLVAEPRGFDRKPFILAKVNGENAFDSEHTNDLFGPNAFDNLFNPADVGDLDEDLGYELEYIADDFDGGEYVANMTDKELAVARLTYQIELLKDGEII